MCVGEVIEEYGWEELSFNPLPPKYSVYSRTNSIV